MGSIQPEISLPRVWCDFNAWGWTGEPVDDCFYVLDEAAILALGASGGELVFAWDEDSETEVIGCVGRLERFQGGWRLRPCEGTLYRGPLAHDCRASSLGKEAAD